MKMLCFSNRNLKVFDSKSLNFSIKVFGLALLIASGVYLNKLNHWAETSQCSPDIRLAKQTLIDNGCEEIISCLQYKNWMQVSIIGIVVVSNLYSHILVIREYFLFPGRN